MIKVNFDDECSNVEITGKDEKWAEEHEWNFNWPEMTASKIFDTEADFKAVKALVEALQEG